MIEPTSGQAVNQFKINWIQETARNYSVAYGCPQMYAINFAIYVAWPRFVKNNLIRLVSKIGLLQRNSPPF